MPRDQIMKALEEILANKDMSSVIWALLAQMGSAFFQIFNHLKTLKYH